MSDLLQHSKRWSRAEYDRLVELGVLDTADKVELIEGVIVEKMPQYSAHATSTGLCEDALKQAFCEGYHVRVQMPLAISDWSEPEPDVAVVTGTRRDYSRSHPMTAVLVVEVAESSLSIDRGEKLRGYAAAGIQEYWIVNLVNRVVEVHRQPAPHREQPGEYTYLEVATLAPGDIISPLGAPHVSIPVADLLP
ncbi:MAG: Uma2 family endonuclease [Candidatus Xenobia bacterium]